MPKFRIYKQPIIPALLQLLSFLREKQFRLVAKSYRGFDLLIRKGDEMNPEVCPKHNLSIVPGKDCEQCVLDEEFTICKEHNILVELFIDCPQCIEKEIYGEYPY